MGGMDRSLEDEVLLSVARLTMAASVWAADRIGDISTVQLRALTAIRDLADGNLVRLAEELGVGVSTTSRLVDRLVAAKLVDRRPSPRTRREISLRLTRKGTALLTRFDDLRVEWLRDNLGGVPDHERRTVIAGLGRWLAAAHTGSDSGAAAGSGEEPAA